MTYILKKLDFCFQLYKIGIMELKKYIEARKLTIDKAASELGISRGYLYELVSRRMLVGRKTGSKIIAWSDGMVTFEDLWKEDSNQ